MFSWWYVEHDVHEPAASDANVTPVRARLTASLSPPLPGPGGPPAAVASGL
jgi:hypothetical protein